MPRKVGIIGMGHVGSTAAHGLIAQGVLDDYVLIDNNEKEVTTDAVDFTDVTVNLSQRTGIVANDYQTLADAGVAIPALGSTVLQDNSDADHFTKLPSIAEQVPPVAKKLKEVDSRGTIITISNSVDVVTSFHQRYSKLPKERIIDTGTLFDIARMKRAVSERFGVDARSVYGYSLGEHGGLQFTAQSQVRMKGQPVSTFTDAKTLDEIAHEAMIGGHVVSHGREYISYDIASAAIRLALVAMPDSHEELPVSNYYGPLDTYLDYPAIVGRKRIIERIKLILPAEEGAGLENSINPIKRKFIESLN